MIKAKIVNIPLEINLVDETTTLASGAEDGRVRAPSVTRLPDGGFAFAYSQDLIISKIFDANADISYGKLFVNTTLPDTAQVPKVTTLANGGFVVVWQDAPAWYPQTIREIPQIKSQVYDQYGEKVGGNFVIGDKSNGPQMEPSVTALTNGSFVVSWYDGSNVSSDKPSYRAKIFAEDGTILREKINLPNVSPESSSISALSDDRFLFAGISGSKVIAQIYDKSGNTLIPSFQVDDGIDQKTFYTLDATPLASGGCVIVWGELSNGHSDNSYIKAQILDENGKKIGSEFRVNSTTKGNNLWPSVDALSNGGFAISWVNSQSDPGVEPRIFVQAFEHDGSRIGKQILLGTGVEPDVAGLDDGRIIVSWSHIYDQGGSLTYDIQGQLLNLVKPGNVAPLITTSRGGSEAVVSTRENATMAVKVQATDVNFDTLFYAIAGGVDANKFHINPVTGELRFRTAPDFEAPGDFGRDNFYNVIVKASDGYLVDKQAITIRILDVVRVSTVGNDAPEKIKGTTESDRIDARGGNDVLDPGGGADIMLGGGGNDTYYVDNPKDRVFETITTAAADNRDSGGVDTVYSTVSFTLLDSRGLQFVENIKLLGTGNLAATGNSLDNHLAGNERANVLKGLNGSDSLVGNGGSDWLYGGNGRDTLTGGAGKDYFVFDTAPDETRNVDLITDFNRIEGDKIVFRRSVYSGFDSLGTLKIDQFYSSPGAQQAQDSSDRLVYDPVSGILSYDSDGNGPKEIQQVAVLGKSVHPDLYYVDISIIL